MTAESDELILSDLMPSRRRVKRGDLFVLRPVQSQFYFGRVLSTDTRIGGFEDVILCYIYSNGSESEAEVPELRFTELLIPPFGIDRSPWSRGCFKTIQNNPISSSDRLPVHCFKHPLKDRYYDEYQNVIPMHNGPIGIDVVHSDITIDYTIGKALGLISS